jgi:hypothetical protein
MAYDNEAEALRRRALAALHDAGIRADDMVIDTPAGQTVQERQVMISSYTDSVAGPRRLVLQQWDHVTAARTGPAVALDKVLSALGTYGLTLGPREPDEGFGRYEIIEIVVGGAR